MSVLPCQPCGVKPPQTLAVTGLTWASRPFFAWLSRGRSHAATPRPEGQGAPTDTPRHPARTGSRDFRGQGRAHFQQRGRGCWSCARLQGIQIWASRARGPAETLGPLDQPERVSLWLRAAAKPRAPHPPPPPPPPSLSETPPHTQHGHQLTPMSPRDGGGHDAGFRRAALKVGCPWEGPAMMSLTGSQGARATG